VEEQFFRAFHSVHLREVTRLAELLHKLDIKNPLGHGL
jgi:hypothetical protein